jgi:hypothetical protein
MWALMPMLRTFSMLSVMMVFLACPMKTCPMQK